MSDTMKSWDLFEGFSRYQRDVMRTMPKFERRESMCNAALGLAGEAGEAAEIIKKVLFQGHPLDKEQIKKELGDVAFYLTYCGILLDIDLSEIIEANVLKRLERFPDGFSPNASRARVDLREDGGQIGGVVRDDYRRMVAFVPTVQEGGGRTEAAAARMCRCAPTQELHEEHNIEPGIIHWGTDTL